MKKSLKFALVSLALTSSSAFAMENLDQVQKSMMDAINAALSGGGIHSVDDKLSSLTRLLATKDCDALGVVSGESYLLFKNFGDEARTYDFRSVAASENITLAENVVFGIVDSEIGSNYNDSKAPVAIVDVDTQEVCRFTMLSSL